MKKNLSKVISLMLILVMAMSLVACGSSSKKTSSENSQLAALKAEELVEKLSTASKEIEGLSATANIDIAVSMSGSEKSLTGTVDTKSIIDPMQAYAKADVTLNALGQEYSQSFESYETMTDNLVEMYTNTDGEWNYSSEDISDTGIDLTEITNMMENIDYSKVSEYFDSIDVTSKKGNYELILKASTGTLLGKAEEAGLTSLLGDFDTSIIPDATMTLTVVCDGETYLPKTASLGLDMDTIEYEGMEIELTNFAFDMKYNSYNNIEITIPDEALAAK